MALNSQDAITILLDDGGITSVELYEEAKKIGAEALEAWAWVGKEEHNVLCNIKRKRWEVDSGVRIIGYGPTPLDAVMDAMEKEGKG